MKKPEEEKIELMTQENLCQVSRKKLYFPSLPLSGNSKNLKTQEPGSTE